MSGLARGGAATDAGRLYHNIAKEMKRYSDIIPRFKMIKFEDFLKQPFDIAEELFTFSDVSPKKLERLRLKSKKVINKQGEHKSTFEKREQEVLAR